jgi:hypothetical protein
MLFDVKVRQLAASPEGVAEGLLGELPLVVDEVFRGGLVSHRCPNLIILQSNRNLNCDANNVLLSNWLVFKV